MMHESEIANAVKAVEEEEELEGLIDVLGDDDAQQAAKHHLLPVLITRVFV